MSQLEEVANHGAGVPDTDGAIALRDGLMEADQSAQSFAVDESGVFQIDLHVFVIWFEGGSDQVSYHTGTRSAEIFEFVDQQGITQ